ncbi:hypothetical protein BMS3Abin15_00414 [bacterium BMS3Abin15]|nr:hypothetical protein BMS3Abin15_00414 [bacterium BMS3Abin15]HDZ85767.1 hypothetical protein [Candidatus Moranbacteria bacterium]
MNFKERLNLVQDILSDCPYETQKEKIIELFKITKNNVKEDILLRLFVIDSCYSTNMNRRLFGFEELIDLILKIDSQLNENINIEKFIEINFKLLNHNIGIDKKGNSKGHAFSLITKYIYFRTKFNFPIYDRLVYDGLVEEKLIKRPKHQRQEPSPKYFKKLIDIKDKYNITFDDLDKYFWVCGKVREGNLSLLISDIKSYNNDFLDKLNLDKEEQKLKSDKFNEKLSEKLVSEKELFDNSKLKKVQKLAKSIKNERVFDNLNLMD